METTPIDQQGRLSGAAEERAAATWNVSGGVRRHGPAYAAFAQAVGHVAAIRDPELFWRSRVGIWPSMDAFVSQYIVDTGLTEPLRTLPDAVRPFAVIDHARVADDLRQQLLVVEVGERIWVFDAQDVVKTTVEETQR